MNIRRISQQRSPLAQNTSSQRFQTIQRLWKELSKKRALFLLVLFFILINAVLGVMGPLLIGKTVDHIVYDGGDKIGLFLLGLVFVYLFYSITAFLQNYWMINISQDTVYRLRRRLFEHIQLLPISFFDRRQHGELMSRFTNDMDNVSSTLNSSVIHIFSSVLTLGGTLVVMVRLSPLLTVITLLVVPIMFFGMRWITNLTGKLFREQQKYLGELNGYIEESISGQKIIKAYSREEEMMEQFLEKSKRLREAGYWAQTYSGFIPKLMNLLNNFSFAMIALIGGILAMHGSVSIGVMITFTEYARQFTRPLNELANQFNTLLSAIAGAERVFDILDTKTEDENDSGEDVEHIRGEVTFSHVSFSYEKSDSTIMDVHFHVNPGEMVALVGPTGAGKTTIINLLSRFYDCDSGAIFIDGKNIQQISRSSLRKSMGFVLQDVFLFEGTIRENIRYGRLDATDEEVEEAAKQANAHSFIMRLPQGYDTVLSGDATGISQGQKQLLSIARAILRNPSILILDEATSNIDTVTELKIQEALKQLMKGRTTFCIAHRLNTIRHADQILVIKDGKLIEKGTHESLIQTRGFYYDLYTHSDQKDVG
ncbi:ABC transporter ATP-binding protein [Fervidibacillus halotolerans]|uniref:ABC transporter ATP-binding protein/permease n=1 Tax=Fervidibacillus halotolerans TaxID=2980027 RepID=A0A9E8M191_9BACI|nr:ABC transporter ATP-binding protein [Fervidibacillus halotolerans]WAA13326.1 ABC transporter ATP-binding protein/permease [Fervidibacillus halotolerans]